MFSIITAIEPKYGFKLIPSTMIKLLTTATICTHSITIANDLVTANHSSTNLNSLRSLQNTNNNDTKFEYNLPNNITTTDDKNISPLSYPNFQQER